MGGSWLVRLSVKNDMVTCFFSCAFSKFTSFLTKNIKNCWNNFKYWRWLENLTRCESTSKDRVAAAASHRNDTFVQQRWWFVKTVGCFINQFLSFEVFPGFSWHAKSPSGWWFEHVWTILKNMSSWMGRIIPYIWKIKCMLQTTNQPCISTVT